MSVSTTIEPWFIPFSILMFICVVFSIIFFSIFLLNIIFDKTCHTLPMILVANSCFSAFIFGCNLLSTIIFTLQNDVKQIEYQDSLCIFRGYFGYSLCTVLNNSFLLQSFHRYVTVVYPSRLFWQTRRTQTILICFSWILSFIFPIPLLVRNDIIYNVDNQICLVPLRLSFSIIYLTTFVYLIPVSMIKFIYLKLMLYVRRMGKNITPANTLIRARRELKMVQRTVILILILFTFGFPYALFTFMSFFTNIPTHHFRIIFIFIDMSLLFLMIVLLLFTDPLKISLMQRINKRQNIVATVM